MANIHYIGSVDTLYILQKLDNVLKSGYVAKESGKGLSTNDLTDTLLARLNGISEGATKTEFQQITGATDATKIATITIDGTPIDIYAPKTEVDMAMSDTSTNPVQNKIVKKYIDDEIAGVVQIDIVPVTQLPQVGKKGVIYLLPNTGSGTNTKDEYIWVESESRYEKIGTTDIDLTSYLKIADINEVSTTDIDTMFNNVFGTTTV